MELTDDQTIRTIALAIAAHSVNDDPRITRAEIVERAEAFRKYILDGVKHETSRR